MNEYSLSRDVECGMMKSGIRIVSALLVISLGMGCTTAYDQYGRPRQVIEPGTALVGAAAIGLIAYGLASSNRSQNCEPHYRPHGYHRGYYNPHYYAPQPCRY